MAPRLHFRQLLVINNIAALTHGWHKKSSRTKGGSKERVQGVCNPPPPPPRDDQRLSNYHCAVASQLICFLSSSHYVIALSKAFFFVFAFKICLRHQSVTPSLSGVPPPKKNPVPAYARYNDAQVYAPIASCLVCSFNVLVCKTRPFNSTFTWWPCY